jgi:hypothetical protein
MGPSQTTETKTLYQCDILHRADSKTFRCWEYEAEYGVQQHDPTDSGPAFVWEVTGSNLEIMSTTVVKQICTFARR